MQSQQSQKVLVILENITEHYLSATQKQLAVNCLGKIPTEAELDCVIQSLKSVACLIAFALIAEQLLLH